MAKDGCLRGYCTSRPAAVAPRPAGDPLAPTPQAGLHRSVEEQDEPRKTLTAYGCNVETVMREYVRFDEQPVADEVTAQLADALAPRNR